MTGMPVLDKETILAAIRECVTVVRPGETLVIRAPDGWYMKQIDELGSALRDWDLPFRAIVVPGAEFAVVQSEGDE